MAAASSFNYVDFAAAIQDIADEIEYPAAPAAEKVPVNIQARASMTCFAIDKSKPLTKSFSFCLTENSVDDALCQGLLQLMNQYLVLHYLSEGHGPPKQIRIRSFQCVMGTKTKGMNGSGHLWSLILVLSPTEQMRLYFISQQAAKHWHSLVLEKQGF